MTVGWTMRIAASPGPWPTMRHYPMLIARIIGLDLHTSYEVGTACTIWAWYPDKVPA